MHTEMDVVNAPIHFSKVVFFERFRKFSPTMFARKALLSLLAMLIASSVLGFVAKPFARAFTATSSLSMSSFYDIKEKDASGNEVSFSKFKGKVVYGVNVATKCGYTASGYALLSKIAKMKADGVEVAIFPCNQVHYHLILSLHVLLACCHLFS